MSRQENSEPGPPSHTDLPWRPALVTVLLLLACIAIELMLRASDYGLLDSGRWRVWAYQNGAFWSGLLDNWRVNYPAQPYTMFLTYSFLHAGWSHLIGNMAVLYLMGRILVPRIGQIAFLFLYLGSAAGGAALFAMLNDSAQPMVGASGALFGLVGAWRWQEWFLQAGRKNSRRKFLLDLVGLVFLNLLLWVFQNGQLAWETHLGGFLAGWLIGSLMIPRHDSNTI